MKLHVVEVSNGFNWGKFGIAQPDEEWQLKSEVAHESTIPLFRQLGWGPDHLWVVDLQTGEGAFFRPGGSARADLEKHRIWVCPLFEPFLEWLYRQDTSDVFALPRLVHVDAPGELFGHRREGEFYMVEDPLPDVEVGDTDELDAAWDALAEADPEAIAWFALHGVPLTTVSKLMRLGYNAATAKTAADA